MLLQRLASMHVSVTASTLRDIVLPEWLFLRRRCLGCLDFVWIPDASEEHARRRLPFIFRRDPTQAGMVGLQHPVEAAAMFFFFVGTSG